MKRKIKQNQKKFFYTKNFYSHLFKKYSYIKYVRFNVFHFKDLKYIKNQDYHNFYILNKIFINKLTKTNIVKYKNNYFNYYSCSNYLPLFSFKKQFYFKNLDFFLFLKHLNFRNYFYSKNLFFNNNNFFFLFKNNKDLLYKIDKFLKDYLETNSNNLVLLKNKNINLLHSFNLIKNGFFFDIFIQNLKNIYIIKLLLLLSLIN